MAKDIQKVKLLACALIATQQAKPSSHQTLDKSNSNHMPAQAKQPDIEIYVKQGQPRDLASWLAEHFDNDAAELEQWLIKYWDAQGTKTTTLARQSQTITLAFTANAAGKAFRSLWFQSNATPWCDDKACALSLLERFDGEVRCSESSWTEAEEEFSEKWWCLTRTQEKLITWG